MLNVKNISTGEVKVVYRVHFNNANNVFTFEGVPSEKVLAKIADVFTYDGNNDEKGNAILTISPNWEKATKAKATKTNEPKAAKVKKATKAEKVTKTDTTNEPTATSEPEPTNEPKNEPKPKAKAKATAKAKNEPKADEPKTDTANNDGNGANDDVNEQALIAAIRNLKGGAVDVSKVREIVAEELAKLAENNPQKAAKLAKIAKANTGNTKEVFCKKFDRIVAKVARGINVYLYGRAGSGKSHTAEQVARALGLDFYGQTTIQFAHDVRGYGDAGGNFQDTPFFKAFCYGGLYFQDEYDRSNPEAAIVLNSALANGWYDFPIVGRVTAHENFRFMAAGNTTMNGADEEYVTGQVMDASSRDRFGFFFEVDYNHEVEMAIAHNDGEIVEFVEDVRNAIREAGVLHVVSYRATACMIDERENENDLEACLSECVFKGLDVDTIREISGKLHKTGNAWAKALNNII